MATQYEQVFDVFKQFPSGLTSFELDILVDEITPKPNTSSVISQLTLQGLAVKDGTKCNPRTGLSVFLYKPTGRLFADRLGDQRSENRKRRGPFEAEVKELRAWKADAIARFPELGIAPSIVSARKHVAGVLRSEGNVTKALMIEHGDLDDSDMMRAVAALFEA